MHTWAFLQQLANIYNKRKIHTECSSSKEELHISWQNNAAWLLGGCGREVGLVINTLNITWKLKDWLRNHCHDTCYYYCNQNTRDTVALSSVGMGQLLGCPQLFWAPSYKWDPHSGNPLKQYCASVLHCELYRGAYPQHSGAKCSIHLNKTSCLKLI